MTKFEYSVEYSWKIEQQLITMVILCNAGHDNDLIGLTDEIYDEQIKKYNEVEIYFFNTKDAATNYVYVRFVQKRDEKDVLLNSGCIGDLVDGKLTGHMSPPKLLKTYFNPALK